MFQYVSGRRNYSLETATTSIHLTVPHQKIGSTRSEREVITSEMVVLSIARIHSAVNGLDREKGGGRGGSHVYLLLIICP